MIGMSYKHFAVRSVLTECSRVEGLAYPVRTIELVVNGGYYANWLNLQRVVDAMKILQVIVFGVFLKFSAHANAFDLVSQSAVWNQYTNSVDFSIRFDSTPDFLTVDSAGRAANSFQYYIFGDPNAGYPEKYAAIIRGEEIRYDGNIVVRSSSPSDWSGPPINSIGTPRSGGWGAILGEVSYVLNGSTIAFSVSTNLLGKHGPNYKYEFGTYSYGSTTSSVTDYVATSSVPEPETYATMIAGLGLLGFMARRQKFA
jgi:hypothetical protein